jgi:hypothetical protein
LSTVERVMQIVSAHLYRAEIRSAVAESAWASVTSADMDRAVPSDVSVVALVHAARARAVASIVEGKHPASITEAAIDTLDHAIYAALSEASTEDAVSTPQTTDAMRHEPRS